MASGLAACGGGSTAGSATTLTGTAVSPASVTVAAGSRSVQFFTQSQSPHTIVDWDVDGKVGGDAYHGTITSEGLYTPPAAQPSPATVNVTATDASNGTPLANAAVTITAPAGGTTSGGTPSGGTTSGATTSSGTTSGGTTSSGTTSSGTASSGTTNAGGSSSGTATGLLAQRMAAIQAAGFPRRAALAFGGVVNTLGVASNQAALARFDLVILGLYPRWAQNGYTIQSVAAALKGLKPSLLLGNYSILNEAIIDTTGAYSVRTAKLNATNWWLRNAAGNQVQWNSGYGAWDVNITTWAAPDSNGQRYPQWAAGYFDQQFFAGSPVFDFWYFDNVMFEPRDPPADWKLNGTNQNSTDADVASAFRAGEAAEWAEARKLEPNMLLIGNADNDLSYVEYKGQLNSAFLECMTGASYSIENSGWGQMMSRYRAVVANLAPPQIAVFGACGGATDYAMFRYSLASALMGDGYFAYSGNGDYSSEPWYDEYNVNLGVALQPAVTAAYQKGVYRRDFQNGIVLVNPRGNGTQTVTLGGTFHKIAGTQDSTTNNGQAVTSVTLNAADGIVLTR